MRTENEKSQALMLCLVAAIISVSGVFSTSIATLLAIAYAAYLILYAGSVGLPALGILWIQAIDFSRGPLEVSEFTPGTVEVGGFSFSLPLSGLILMNARVFIEWVFRPRTFLNSRWLTMSFFLWVILFALTAISAGWGSFLENSNWTQPLRASMSLGVLYYGIIIGRQLRLKAWVAHWILAIGAIVLCLMVSGVYWNHVGFFYLTLGASCVNYAFRKKSWIYVAIFFIAPFSFAVTFGNTLTILALVMLGFIFSLLTRLGKRASRDLLSIWTAGLLALPFAVIIVVLASGAVPYRDTGASNLINRFEHKLFWDRGVFWVEAWGRAVEDPRLITPSGQTLVLSYGQVAALREWDIHVHNAFLEMLRQTGVLGSLIFLAVVLTFLLKVRRSILASINPSARCFGIAAFVATVVGSTTGMFPFDFHAGPWIWMWAGVAIHLTKASGGLSKAFGGSVGRWTPGREKGIWLTTARP